MEIKNCPKCNSNNVSLCSCAGITINYGLGIRVQCNNCGFKPPASKWQRRNSEKAIEIWNDYKRKN